MATAERVGAVVSWTLIVNCSELVLPCASGALAGVGWGGGEGGGAPRRARRLVGLVGHRREGRRRRVLDLDSELLGAGVAVRVGGAVGDGVRADREGVAGMDDGGAVLEHHGVGAVD